MKCTIYFKRNISFYNYVESDFFDSIIFRKNEIGLFDINFKDKYNLLLNYKDSFECRFSCYLRNSDNNTQIFFNIISMFLNCCEIISNNDNILNELANEYEIKYGKLNYDRIKANCDFENRYLLS